MIVREGPAAPRAGLKRRQPLRETALPLAGEKRRAPAPAIIDLLEDDGDDVPGLRGAGWEACELP